MLPFVHDTLTITSNVTQNYSTLPKISLHKFQEMCVCVYLCQINKVYLLYPIWVFFLCLFGKSLNLESKRVKAHHIISPLLFNTLLVNTF